MRDYAIILAADLSTPSEVISVVRRVADHLDGIKVAAATVLQSGLSILQQIRDIIRDKPLLLDLKIADIGFQAQNRWDGTNAKIIGTLKGSGVTHVTVHGFPGPVSVAEAVNVARASAIEVLLLPLMSHVGASLFFSRPLILTDVLNSFTEAKLDPNLPINAACSDVTEAILLLGEALDVSGYIGPATRPEDLKRYRRITQRRIWCPGFGRQDRKGRGLDQQFSEWAQIVGPASAAIVGSIIFRAPDPEAVAKEIAEIRDRVTE